MSSPLHRLKTGVPGLDEILSGGIPAGRTYLLTGPPGTGKTTLGWQFLLADPDPAVKALYVTFSEQASDLRDNARRLGFNPDLVELLDLSPSPDAYTGAEPYDLFTEGDAERQPATQRIVAEVQKLKPKKIFIDSMTSLRFLTIDAFAFRRQALAFLRFLTSQGATVFCASESTAESPDDDLRFICDGVIEVERSGRTWSIEVTKLRGSPSRSGRHGMVLTDQGAVVFPRLLPERHAARHTVGKYLPSGLVEFDEMLHGGIDSGSVTLISGPTGAGKTTLSVQLMLAAAATGRRSVLYSFDERIETLLHRANTYSSETQSLMDANMFAMRSIEALRYGADEFAQLVRDDVERLGTSVVSIDSINGYRMTIEGPDLTERVHALARYLQNVGVTVLISEEIQEFATFKISDSRISYLADNVVYLRYVESVHNGIPELRKGIGILKKRMSDFSKHMREYIISDSGLTIGQPLAVSTVLTGGCLENRDRTDT